MVFVKSVDPRLDDPDTDWEKPKKKKMAPSIAASTAVGPLLECELPVALPPARKLLADGFHLA
jgi:hypothetical protein